MTFSATEAAFEGFRITRTRPGAALIWAGLWLIVLAAVMGVTMPIVTPFAEQIQASGGDTTKLGADATQALNLASALAMPLLAVAQAILMPAVFRVVYHQDNGRFGGVRLGADELRMLAVTIAVMAVSVALNVGGEWLANLIRPVAGVAGAALFSLVLVILSFWVSVKMSLIAPLTQLRGRLAFAEGWRLTHGRFWLLLGLTVLVVVMAVVVVLLLMLVGLPATTLVMSSGGQATPLASLGALIVLLLMPLAATLTTTIVWAPFAVATQAFVSDPPRP